MHTQSDPTALAVHPTPDVSPGSDHHRHEGSRLRLATAVMFVTDLARSIEFYQGLLRWDVTVEDDNVALLAGPEGFQMYLHRHGPRAQHPLAPDRNPVPDLDCARRCETSCRNPSSRCSSSRPSRKARA